MSTREEVLIMTTNAISPVDAIRTEIDEHLRDIAHHRCVRDRAAFRIERHLKEVERLRRHLNVARREAGDDGLEE